MTMRHWLYLCVSLETTIFLVAATALYSTGHPIGGSLMLALFLLGQIVQARIRPPDVYEIFAGSR